GPVQPGCGWSCAGNSGVGCCVVGSCWLCCGSVTAASSTPTDSDEPASSRLPPPEKPRPGQTTRPGPQAFGDAAIARAVLDSLKLQLDWTAAAAETVRRKRWTFVD